MTIHIVGAGIAGLAAAIRLTETGYPVRVYEANPYAGGRVRSFFDRTLERIIDNGTHLLLSGNERVNAYLQTIGTADHLEGPPRARLDFVDVPGGSTWSLQPNGGPIPWWIADPKRRIPGTRFGDYLSLFGLAVARPTAVVADVLKPGTEIFERLWDPLCVSVMNTPTSRAGARLLWPVIRETLGRGEAYCRPRLVRRGLSAGFIDPALRWLEKRGVGVRLSTRLTHLERSETSLSRLVFGESGHPPVVLAPEDRVIMAVPPAALKRLLADPPVPDQFHPIVNVHYRLDPRLRVADNGTVPIGLIGHRGDWVFVNGDVVSVTVSAADDLDGQSGPDIAAAFWPGVWAALRFRGLINENSDDRIAALACPPARVIREQRATIAQTPEQILLRPETRTGVNNLFLAGDWTQTGLPATIEGAIRSGEKAARAAAGGGFRR